MKKGEFSKNFSSRLQVILDGRTQTSVSKRLGYSQAVLSKYLMGDTPESFLLLAKLAREYKIDLHRLLAGENSPIVAELIRRLKPYVVACLHEITQKMEFTKTELIELLRKQAMGKGVHLERINEISEEIEELQIHHDTIVNSVNEVLEPLGEKI